MDSYTSFKLFKEGLIVDDWQLLPLARVVGAYLRSISHSPANTLRAKKSDLDFYLAYHARAERLDRVFLTDHTPQAIASFLANRLQMETAATVLRRLSTLRHFDEWLHSRIPAVGRPSHEVKGPQAERGAWEGLSIEEANALIAAAYSSDGSPDLALRNGLIADMLLSTGLRIDEVLSLRAKQLSQCGQWLRQVVCKGQKVRDVYLPQRLDESLAAWLKVRQQILKKHRIKNTDAANYPLFISNFNAQKSKPDSFRVSYKTFWRVLKIACELAGIEQVSPHKLRHSFAQLLLNKTHDIRFVAQALGHSDVKTTMRYTERSQKQIGQLIENAMEGADDSNQQQEFRDSFTKASNSNAERLESSTRKAVGESRK